MTDRTNLAGYYSLPFFLAFALSALMLVTDTNLRTDFGTVTSGYYFHWYVVLAAAVADLVGAVLLVGIRTRATVKGGVVGSSLLLAIFLGDILTYMQVGLASPAAFAQYLFGITYHGGDIRYLYDVLLAVYGVAFVAGLAILGRTRASKRTPPSSAEPSPPSG